MLYLDASLVVAALTQEARTGDVQAWLSHQAGETLAVSDWVTVEFSAVVAAKGRLGKLGPDFLSQALDAYERLLQGEITSVAVTGADFRRAADLALRSPAPLRGADALHLAVSDLRSATLCTLDRRQAEAGASLGLQTILP